MTTRRVAAVCALALAAALALLANAVLSVGGGARAGTRAHDDALMGSLATGLVGERDTTAAQQAVKYLLERSGGVGAVLRRHAQSREILAKLASSGQPAERSWAANLLGAVEVQDSSLDPTNAARYVQLAQAAFRHAILSDRGNEDPKFNLELLLTLKRSGQQNQGRAQKARKSITKKRNAQHRESGYGY